VGFFVSCGVPIIAKAAADSSKPAEFKARFQEIASAQTGPLRIDEQQGIIFDVLFIGTKKSGRGVQNGIYTPEVVGQAIQKYEGVPTYVGHTKDGSNPDYAKKLGVHRNVRAVPEGGRSDFHFNVDHPCAKQLIWDAKNDPTHVGFSQDADCTCRLGPNGRRIVTSIDEVYSLDLVTKPATTHGLMEEDGDDEQRLLESDPELRSLAESTLAATDNIRTILFAPDVPIETRRERLKEAVVELQAELTAPPEGPAGKILKEESTTMGVEYKDMTVEELTKNRPDLVAVLKGTDDKSRLQEEAKTLTATVTAKDAELAALKAENDGLKAKEAKRLREEEILAELTAANFPVSDPKLFTAKFKEHLMAAPSKEARAEEIAERMSLISGRMQEQAGQAPPLAEFRQAPATPTADKAHEARLFGG
jgi:hypothetical protein